LRTLITPSALVAHQLAKTANHLKFPKVVAMILLSRTGICGGGRFRLPTVEEGQISGGNGMNYSLNG